MRNSVMASSSAIDFDMEIQRKQDPKGDRVVVTRNGRFRAVQKVLASG